MDRPLADAVVVLGCALRDGEPSPALCRRAACGAAVFSRRAAPLLVLSGGGAGLTEAEAMRRIAAAKGVPPGAILLESRSRNTFENAAFTAALLAERGLTRIILVSDRYHLPRARLHFRGVGLVILGSASPQPLPWRRELPLWLREAAALLLLALRRGADRLRRRRRRGA